MARTLFTSCNALSLAGTAAPAVWQSQFRGPGLKGCWAQLPFYFTQRLP
jgi:hypothetical protein